jgi:lipopolysaccharide export system permease protein
MGSIGRYIFRTTMGAFVLILVSLTVVLWFTQAMRDFDLITSQRQTLLVFVEITGLIIPLLVMMIAPIALVMACGACAQQAWFRFRDHRDECRRVSPWRLLRPFLAAALVVSLLVVVIAAWGSPRSLRSLREWASQVRADILTNIVQPGRLLPVAATSPSTSPTGSRTAFSSAYSSMTARSARTRHLPRRAGRDRQKRQRLVPGASRAAASSASKPASATRASLLSISTHSTCRKFTGGPQSIVYTAREKYLWELMWPRADDALYEAQPDQYRSELNDRLATPLYPLAFIIVAYAFLGPPQTTRQSRALAVWA